MAKVQGPSGRLVELVPIDFEVAGEPWVKITLEDGSELKFKVVVSSVQRFDGEYDTVGNPIYAISTQNVTRIMKVGKGLRGEPTISPQAKGKDGGVPGYG